MEAKINEQALDEKLEALEKARAWSPRAISKLETFIRSADDFALFRVNPLRFAADRNIAEPEAIDLFLHAAKAGLFHMTWNLMCPSCGSPVNSFAELKALHASYYCGVCDLHSTAALDDYIQVAFTIAPLVRDIIFHHPDRLSIEDYAYKYHYHRGARLPDGTEMSALVASVQRYGSYLEPGETKNVELDLPAGILVCYEFTTDSVGRIILSGEPPQVATARLSFRGNQLEAAPGQLAPGRITFTLTSHAAKRAVVMLFLMPPNAQSPGVEFDPFLTGKRLLNIQTFRDLFRSETIQSGDGLSVKDLTVLFTDLKGSTSLYDRIGDLNAFALVRQHFDRLGAVITQHSGAVVKTIGDAVMATFINPTDGVQAALLILKEIEQLNRSLGNQDVILKIGIHKGALIAVTLNDRLDYFGQTVNIASRVQGLADAEEIYVTNSIYDYAGVPDLLKEYQVAASEAQLKGIERGMRVYKIAYHPA
jgi:class 3 adenylate cyclase